MVQEHAGSLAVVLDQHRGDKPSHEGDALSAAVGLGGWFPPGAVVGDLDAHGSALGVQRDADRVLRTVAAQGRG
jgi:hypothetical protein